MSDIIVRRLGGVEMAWGCPRHDRGLEWSAAVLLEASIELFVAFLVLICAVLNLVTSCFIRASGFPIPCAYCTRLQKGQLGNAVDVCQNCTLEKPSSTSRSVVHVRRRGFRDPDVSVRPLKETELENTEDLYNSNAFLENPCYESSLDLFRREGSAAENEGLLQSDQATVDSSDQNQEDVDREQCEKDRELTIALQSERETLASLYSELEQERNSSATAASEALAMISRLQEEKAAVQMEARQFQRMVMEKAMYDQEAIEVLKEILAKQEEEKMALEEEIQQYKERLDAELMEKRDDARKAGRWSLMLESISTDTKAPPKPEPAELFISESISASTRGVKDEQYKYLERLNKTKSQLLTALLQEGIGEPTSIFMEDSASFADEILKAKAKIPVQAETVPTLEYESQKVPLGLGAIKTGREINLSIPPVTKRLPDKALVRDDGKSDEQGHQKAPLGLGASKSGREMGLPIPAARTQTEKSLVKVNEPDIQKAPFGLNTIKTGIEIGLPNPHAKSQVEKSVMNADGTEDRKASLVGANSTGREVGLPIPSAAIKQTEKSVVKEDGLTSEPEFVSLKRRWGSRGSQEISVESLEKTLEKAKEDRRIEEKRLSVLEYVRNLEAQLQQQAGRPPIQIVRGKVSGEEDARFKNTSQIENSTGSITSGNAGLLERDDSAQRRLFEEWDLADSNSNRRPSEEDVDDRSYEQRYSFDNEGDAGLDDEGFYLNIERSEEGADEALFVHDVYEVQNPPHEGPAFGVRVAGNMSVLEMHPPVSDRLGKPDYFNVEEEDTRNNDEQETEFLNNATAFPQEDEDFGIETHWKELERRAQYKDLSIPTLLSKDNSRNLVEEEVEQLTHRLKALEADRYIMKQTIDTLRKENGEMKLLQEIAQQLRELRGMEQKEMLLKDSLPKVLQFQTGPSMSKKRRYNSTPRRSSCRPGTPGSQLTRASSWTLHDSGTEGRYFTPHGVVA